MDKDPSGDHLSDVRKADETMRATAGVRYDRIGSHPLGSLLVSSLGDFGRAVS
jgi:hypothetical protein